MMGCDLLDTFVRICSALPDGLDPSNSAICNSLMPTVSTMEPHPRYEEKQMARLLGIWNFIETAVQCTPGTPSKW